MAVGVAISSNAKAYPGKLTGKVIWTCIVAAMGGLIFGYDIGISGGVTSMPPFLMKFFPDVYMQQEKFSGTNQYCKFNSFPLTMFTSSLYLAALASCLVASTVTRTFGRKLSMVFGGVLFLVGAILNGFAENLAMLYIGRLFLGAGIGFANQAVPLYLSEMAPYKARGALNMMFQLSITIGILSANVLNYFFANIKGGWGWRLSLGGAVVPAIMFIAGSLFLPDTPNSLIERGKVQEAKERLQKIRGVTNVDEELDDMVEASRVSKLIEHPWRKLMQRNYRPHLTFAIGIPFFQQLTGINVIMFYAPVLFKTIGFQDNASLMSAVITGGVNCVATLMSIFTVDKLGRRFWFLEGGTQMFLAQVVTAILIAVKFGVSGNAGTLSATYAGSMVGVICVFVSAFAWSWGPLGWLVPSEIFPLEIRSAAQSINVSVNMLFTFAVAQIFLQMLCHLKFGLFLFFAFFELVMSVFIYYLLPETKNIPIEEMGRVWRSHWYWKKFVPEEEPSKSLELGKEVV